jgi:hypothetical protein
MNYKWMYKWLSGTMLVFCMVGLQSAGAAELSIKSGDSIPKILEDHKSKRVTVRLQGNDELTGTVKMVTKDLLHLGELAGRDYFDAVIELNKISAVIVRIRTN